MRFLLSSMCVVVISACGGQSSELQTNREALPGSSPAEDTVASDSRLESNSEALPNPPPTEDTVVSNSGAESNPEALTSPPPIEDTAPPPTGTLKISWQQSPDYNPFSTEDFHYEVWHNNTYIASIDENSIEIQLADHPELASGCIVIRAVSGNEKSSFSDQSCYSFS